MAHFITFQKKESLIYSPFLFQQNINLTKTILFFRAKIKGPMNEVHLNFIKKERELNMSQKYDVPNLYNFLHQTPEGGLRKLLVDNKPFTEVHFNLMMKVVRGCNEAQFTEHFEKQDFPKVKMNANEVKLKEKFWADAMTVWNNRGLLTPAVATKAA
jgi:hypothetical protein